MPNALLQRIQRYLNLSETNVKIDNKINLRDIIQMGELYGLGTGDMELNC